MRLALPWVGPLRAVVAALILVGLCACGSTDPPGAPSTATEARATVPDPPDPPADPKDPPAVSTVTINFAREGATVPARFVGLSFEASTLGHFAQFGPRGDLAGLLRSLGPGLIRFGGISADTRTAFVDRFSPRPAWAGWTVNARTFHGIAGFARRSGWRVLLTVGLAHYDPAVAAREVAAAHAALGPYLAAVEIGNEPDSYAAHGMRDSSWGVSQYLGQVSAYRRAIAVRTPHIAIVAPDVSGSLAFARWALPVAAATRPVLLTGHHYPLGCRDVPAPSIAQLLSPAVRRAEGASLDRFQSLAAGTRIPFRLDETGSVSCGGEPGISDTFASALWALDISVRAMTTGVSGINFEGNVQHCNTYTPICARTPGRLRGGVLSPQPEWYALLMAHLLVGDRPLAVHVAHASSAVDVAALRAPDGDVQLVAIDDATPGTSGAVRLRVKVGGHFAGAQVLRLAAPSLAARNGVTLGGNAVRRNGSWSPPRRMPTVRAHQGAITVAVAPGSAALITLMPARRVVGRAVRRAHRADG